MIQKFITYDSKMEYGKRVENLYNCHNIIFKNNIMLYYPTQGINQSDVRQQEFTIHHFIYYLIHEAVIIFKRRSKRFTEYEVYELIEENMFNAYDFYLINLFDKFRKLYDYLYPTHNKQFISLLILKLNNLYYKLMPIYLLTDFTIFTKEEVINYLDDDNDTLRFIQLIHNDMKYVEKYNQNTSNTDIDFVEFYKQTIAKERLQIYESELIEKTWHPDRLINWCFDNEEKNDIDNY